MKTFTSNPCARRLLAIALAVFLLGVAGCSSLLEPRPDPSRFYLLTPQPPAGQVSPASAGGGLSVGLGPITMPAYLDRPQTVTRIGANELRVSEVDRWAEPLAKNFTHVLGQDLAARLDGARVHDYPWYNSTAIDYQIEVAVHRFETDASGQSLLAAHWTIVDGRDKRVLDSGNTTLAQSSAPGDVAASTAALSRIVAEFSGQMAATLSRLGGQRQAAAGAHFPPRPQALLRAGTPAAQ